MDQKYTSDQIYHRRFSPLADFKRPCAPNRIRLDFVTGEFTSTKVNIRPKLVFDEQGQEGELRNNRDLRISFLAQ